MAQPVPTRQALRHLRRLVRLTEGIATNRNSNTLESSPCSSHTPRLQTATQGRALSSARSIRAFSTSQSPLKTRHHQQQHHHQNPEPTVSTSNKPNTPSLPDISNYYTLFPKTLATGPPPSGPFAIPLGPLKREFLNLQSQHHPDKYSGSPTAHGKSVALSSLLNTAYKTLSDPLLRARYLLEHTYGVDITSEDNSTHRGVTDQETLIEVMEAQEQVEDAEGQDVIDTLKDENRVRIRETEEKLAHAFEVEDVEAAKRECVRLNYWRSLQQGLDDWEPGKEVRLVH